MVTQYFLRQNYPNPFNPHTTIEFGIREKSNVNITVLNLIGEKVALLLNEEKEAGNYKLIFDASNLTSGVYFYRIKTDNFIQIKKMIVLR